MAAKKASMEELAGAPAKQQVSAEEAEAQRRETGEKLSKGGLVKPTDDGFTVYSDTGVAAVARVNDKTICTCDDFVGADSLGITPYACVHIWAVKHFTMFEQAPETVFDGDGNIVGDPPEEYDETEALVDRAVEEERGPTATIDNVIELLSRKLPRGVIKSKPGWKDKSGNQVMVDFIEWTSAADILDRVAGPNWSFEIKQLEIGTGEAAVVGALTVFGITRQNIGCCSGSSMDMAIKGAASDCLKRCAVMFGVARELYSHDEVGDAPIVRAASFQGNVATTQSRGQSGSPMASNLGDMVTAKQLGMIRAIANESRIDAEEESQVAFRCGVSELSKRAASDLISHLQDLQRGGNGTLQPAEQPEAVPSASAAPITW